MELPNQPSLGEPASLDLSNEMDAALRMFSGLSIHAEQHAAPSQIVVQGADNHYSQLLENIRQKPEPQMDDHKLVFQIPLKTIFIAALKSVGILEPVFGLMRRPASFQVLIQLKSDLPVCILGGSEYGKIVGDCCPTKEAAEESAIRKAVSYLYRMHNVVVVDISSRKESSLLRTSRHVYHNVCDRLKMLEFMIQRWRKCLDDLFEVEKFAYPKLKHCDPVESLFVEPIYQSLQFIKKDAMARIRSFDGKMKDLANQKDDYIQASRSKALICSKASIKKAYFEDVDALALLLQWLNLEEAQYASNVEEDARFLGVVMLSFPSNQNMVPPGDCSIEAKQTKKTIAKAHNAAARAAINFLEMHYNVEVAGYNHNAKLAAEQEMFVWKGLNDQTRMLGAELLKFWEDFLNQIQSPLYASRNRCTMLASQSGVQGAMPFIYDLVRRLEVASTKCTDTFKLAAAKFGSLE